MNDLSGHSMLRRGLAISSSISKLPSTRLSRPVLGGWRKRQHYASNASSAAAAEAPNQDGRRVKGKRVPRAERQAMLKSFVNKYRAMNGGAFPTASQAQKELGGSYYIVKSIIQEIQYTAKMSPSCPAIEDPPVQEEVRETEPLIQVEEDSTRDMLVDDNAENVSEVTYDADLPGLEEVTQIESLTQVEETPTCRLSENASVQNDSVADVSGFSGKDVGAKEEPQISSAVEILSEKVTTAVSNVDLAATQSNMLKRDDGQSSYKDLDEHGNGKEEVKQNLYDSITECQLLEEKFQVVSKPCNKSKNYETEKPQADKHDFVANEKDLPIGETSRAPLPSFSDSEDMKKQEQTSEDHPDVDDPIPNSDEYEDIPQPDRSSKGLSCRQTDDADPSKKLTLWGNVKSLANGIMSIFKKL